MILFLLLSYTLFLSLGANELGAVQDTELLTIFLVVSIFFAVRNLRREGMLWNSYGRGAGPELRWWGSKIRDSFVAILGAIFSHKTVRLFKSTYLLITVVSTAVSIPSVYFLYAFYSDRSIGSLQITCIGLSTNDLPSEYFANYTLVVGFHSPLPWSIHATWLIVVKLTKTFFGSNSSNTEIWTFPGFSNVTIPPGTSQSRIVLFNTNFFGLPGLRTVVAKSVTLVEDYTGPFYYAFHRAYTNPDGFTLNSTNNRVLSPRDFDSNVITAFLFQFVTLTANYGSNSYIPCLNM